MKTFVWSHVALILIFIGASLLIVTGVFAVGLLRHPAQPLPIRTSKSTKRPVNAIVDWMTISYVAKSYAIPEPLLLKAINVSPAEANNRSLKAIAELKKQKSITIISKLMTTIQNYRDKK